MRVAVINQPFLWTAGFWWMLLIRESAWGLRTGLLRLEVAGPRVPEGTQYYSTIRVVWGGEGWRRGRREPLQRGEKNRSDSLLVVLPIAAV